MQKVKEVIKCYHCGDLCSDDEVVIDEKHFCCEGCKLVFEILNENDLCSYYNFNNAPGKSLKNKKDDKRFSYLDSESVKLKLIQFTDESASSVTFFVPQMHCSSCIWLLENLNRINNSIIRSRINFSRKEVYIQFSNSTFTLRNLVELLSTIGYEPIINLNDLENKKVVTKDRSSIYRIGVAGFCFGNIMLFSFPEYFSIATSSEYKFGNVFSYINLSLSIPVLFYCSAPFFKFALQSLKQKFLNIDVPIALGILVMFLRSSIEIISNSGVGYLDTMSGLTFFMLVGRYFQNKTYDNLSFERDYKSFFPISVMVIRDKQEYSIPVSEIKVDDQILIRNEELIPADSILVDGNARIDYSFVTGESRVSEKRVGELIYAGGKHIGPAIELKVVKNVEQSYLTQLWNNDSYLKKSDDSTFQLLVNRISHYFTIAILSISITSLFYWFTKGQVSIAWNAFTAVLIIACPCALAISSPFTLGSILRIFGRNKFYLKNYSVIEKLAKADTIVFDKTGTLTTNDHSNIHFEGQLSEVERSQVASLVFHSNHPLSRLIYENMKSGPRLNIEHFVETKGSGFEGIVGNQKIKLGSSQFILQKSSNADETEVLLSINEIYRGRFIFKNTYRSGLENVIHHLKEKKYTLVVLSGDRSGEREYLQCLFGMNTRMLFNLSPKDKLLQVQMLQQSGKSVLMVGDGLNDAGALRQADVGISVSDNVNNFSPACDAIIDGNKLGTLSEILRIAQTSKKIIYSSFAIALVYNTIGIYFAIAGQMSPLFAAILMPISSITIISFTTLLSGWVGRSHG